MASGLKLCLISLGPFVALLSCLASWQGEHGWGGTLGLLLSKEVTHARELFIGRPRGLMQTIIFLLEGSESLRLLFSYGNSFIAGFLLIIKIINVHSQYISGAP